MGRRWFGILVVLGMVLGVATGLALNAWLTPAGAKAAADNLSIITGVSAGGGAYSPALTDWVMMTENASMFLTGPGVVKEALGEEVTAAELGGHRVHQRNGVCHFVAPTDADAAALARIAA